MRLTRHFSLEEFTRSQVATRLGISNEPGQPEIDWIRRLCVTVLQPMRDILGPIHVTSGYRSPDLNEATGGSRESAHMDGRAADIIVSHMTPREVAEWVASSDLEYDQCILEFDQWVHISVSSEPRGQILTAKKNPGSVSYHKGIV